MNEALICILVVSMVAYAMGNGLIGAINSVSRDLKEISHELDAINGELKRIADGIGKEES